MPLVRIAGTPQPDASPTFWQNWRQLGHAVVIQAIYDYANARKLQEKNTCPKSRTHFNPLSEVGLYERFFRSQYFAHICPGYDGHKLLEILEGGKWKHLPKMHHTTPPPTYMVWEYKPKDKPDPKGRGRKRKYG